MDNDLWPDFDVSQAPRSPKSVITEAGRGLEAKTKGLVKFWPSQTTVKDDQVVVAFSLWAPRLGYQFPFLRAKFSVNGVYPVTIVADKMSDVVANSEEEMISALNGIFHAPTTVESVQRLMALSQ